MHFSGLEVIRILIFEASVDEAIELDFHGNRGSGQSQQYGNRCQRGDLLHLFLLEVVDQRVRAEKHLSMSLTRSLIFSDGMGEGILLRLKVVCRFSKVMGS